MLDADHSQDSAHAPAPRHVAIIMDGNGRWAAKRHLPRKLGHKAGVEAVRKIVRDAGELGVEYLTLYGFSSENWKRPPEEVGDLMELLRYFIRKDLAELHQNGVNIRIIGDREGLEPDILKMIDEAQELTAGNSRLKLIIAFNYGGQSEITNAVRRIAAKAQRGELDPAAITPETVEAHLDTAGVPSPDLVIRTSGEKRLSNFLIWQSAYAELVFTDVFWPDFSRKDLEAAFREYQSRERRFGGR
ncbi:undecaprenyl diphosphate synthase [Tepidicaulis marinus]|uniref:Isoprenyl transferase n=1 Tax=Tepidicaulis marinus TaxID=1333998 RepID=A0A081B920_9HYPH|nr:isoprenyl transferase [Tepidicaulis marinus]GAK44538.1 undecaprenyl diphosphate synthase [Tepidicaulis marinus]